jgi:rod shape-determining protein MreD
MIETLKITLLALTTAFLQVFILQQVDLGFYLHPMPYLFIFLIIPLDFNAFGSLIIAFVYGTFIDVLSGSFGSHAASCVAMIYTKKYIDSKFVDFQSLQLQGENYLSLNSKGLLVFVYYTMTLLITHHLVFFSLDFFSVKQIVPILVSTLFSSAISFLFILLYKHVFNK